MNVQSYFQSLPTKILHYLKLLTEIRCVVREPKIQNNPAKTDEPIFTQGGQQKRKLTTFKDSMSIGLFLTINLKTEP